jgi:alpha-L-arabinofuranosidase
MGTGTPEEAGEWAAYCANWFKDRGAKLPPACFEMGNEQEGHHELGHMTPDMYVAALREFVPAVRAGYQGARIGVKLDEHYYYLRTDQLKPWRETVLAQAADLADFFIIHSYQGQWRETDEERQISVVDGVANLQDQLQKLIAAIRATGGRQTVAVTEWNYWLHAGQSDGKGFREPYDVQHALYVAGALHLFARFAPDLEIANFYNLVNPMGVFLHRGAAVQESCLAEIFRLYRPAFPGDVLPLASDSPLLGTRGLAVDALAMRGEGATWLFLTNRSPSDDATVVLPAEFAKPTDAVMLAGDSPCGQFRRDAVGVKKRALVLPHLSLVRLQFDPFGCEARKGGPCRV